MRLSSLLSGGNIMRKEIRDRLNRRAVLTIAALTATSAVFGGCNKWIEDLATMPLAEQTTTTAVATVKTTVAGIEETTTTTTPERVKPEDAYYLEDIEGELGPYTRYECSGYYVWDLGDGSEIWAFYNDEDGFIRYILKTNGLEETLLYHAEDGTNIYNPIKQDDAETVMLINKEFGPDLDYGWYVYKEAEDRNFILICGGREFTRGNFLYLQNYKYEDYDEDYLTLTVDVEPSSKDLPETEQDPYPYCGLVITKIPDGIVVQDIYGNAIPFKGYISDAEDWGIDEEVDDDYAFFFTDGDSSYTHNTYVYETDDGYRYIDAAIMESSGKTLIKGSGTVGSIDNLVRVADRFGSNVYVTVRGEDTKIPADEYISSLSD